jgi:hypothetical protein
MTSVAAILYDGIEPLPVFPGFQICRFEVLRRSSIPGSMGSLILIPRKKPVTPDNIMGKFD